MEEKNHCVAQTDCFGLAALVMCHCGPPPLSFALLLHRVP